jgi:hypothetical protein
MTDPVADAARSAAAILAPTLGPSLPAEVEAALTARDTTQRPDRFLDLVSLASLIVSIATLAWTIYNDQRKHTPDPPADSIARQVRITLRDQDTALPPAPTGSPKSSPPKSPATPAHPGSPADTGMPMPESGTRLMPSACGRLAPHPTCAGNGPSSFPF